jgi:PPK2 family polyphosphate:nucleotide phosphotransferase
MDRSDLAKNYRVTKGRGFRLKDYAPGDTATLESSDHAAGQLQQDITQMAELQDKLYAQNRWAVLLIFQAMDAAGKDGVIKHVMSGVNPQGCEVHSFKQPSVEELDHDFMWRSTRVLPGRGRIGIFNRSYYEEVLAVRVHPELLDAQRIPRGLVTKHVWRERFDDIAAFERYLTCNGVVIRKFFLNVSKGEQKRRFLARLEQPEKNWKFSAADIRERAYWSDYMTAYEEMIQHTASADAPWYVVPADHKWFTRLVVASVIVETLASLNLAYPKVDRETRKELAAARAALSNHPPKK